MSAANVPAVLAACALVTAALVGVAIVETGFLAQRATVVPGTGGISCGGAPPVATWYEPGLHARLGHANATGGALISSIPSIPIASRALSEEWPGFALVQVHVQQSETNLGLWVTATEEGLDVEFTVAESATGPERRARFAELLLELSPATLEAREAALDELREVGKGSGTGGRFVQYRGSVGIPLDASALHEQLAAEEPRSKAHHYGSGRGHLGWVTTDAAGDELRYWFSLQGPKRSAEIRVADVAARLDADALDGAAITFDPADVAALLDEPDRNVRTAIVQAVLQSTIVTSGLPPLTFLDWRLGEDAWTCSGRVHR